MANMLKDTASSASQSTLEQIPDIQTVTASALKNQFGKVSAQAKKGAVAITRHQRAEFILLSVDRFLDLQRAQTAPLDALTAQFDAMVARMNTPKAESGVARLFKAKPAALGKAAVNAAARAK